MMINKFFFALSLVSLTALLNNGAVVAFTPSGGVNTRVSLSTTSSSKIAPPSLLLTPDQERSLIMAPLSMSTKQEDDDDARWEDVSKKLELIGLGVWLLGISGFILVNNFVGPWPAVMKEIPERTFFSKPHGRWDVVWWWYYFNHLHRVARGEKQRSLRTAVLVQQGSDFGHTHSRTGSDRIDDFRNRPDHSEVRRTGNGATPRGRDFLDPHSVFILVGRDRFNDAGNGTESGERHASRSEKG